MVCACACARARDYALYSPQHRGRAGPAARRASDSPGVTMPGHGRGGDHRRDRRPYLARNFQGGPLAGSGFRSLWRPFGGPARRPGPTGRDCRGGAYSALGRSPSPAGGGPGPAAAPELAQATRTSRPHPNSGRLRVRVGLRESRRAPGPSLP